MEYCFASGNENKIAEIQCLLPKGISLLSLKDLDILEEIEEYGTTLEENAHIKARYVFDKTGIPTFADDTGLEVHALDGQPGVYSARFAGPQKDHQANIDLLLERLQKQNNRKAQFRTVIAFVDAKQKQFFEGIAKGTISFERRGQKGFGYDPVFVPEGEQLSFAEMSLEQKNQFSHRAKALQAFLDFLKAKTKA